MALSNNWLAAILIAVGSVMIAIGASRWKAKEVIPDATEATCNGTKAFGESCKIFLKSDDISHTAPGADGKVKKLDPNGHCYAGVVEKDSLTGTPICKCSQTDATASVSAVIDQKACAIEGDSCRTWTGTQCIKGQLTRNSVSDPQLVCKYRHREGDGSWLLAAGGVFVFVGMVVLYTNIVRKPISGPDAAGGPSRSMFPSYPRSRYATGRYPSPVESAPSVDFGDTWPPTEADSLTQSTDSDIFNPLR